MKNIDKWKPTKLVVKNGNLVASLDPREVGIASRLGAGLVAALYWKYLKVHSRGRLLDLGCGNVPMYEAYRDFVDEIICVDWANTLHKNEHLDYECDLTGKIPLPDSRFETIILSSVLGSVENQRELTIAEQT